MNVLCLFEYITYFFLLMLFLVLCESWTIHEKNDDYLEAMKIMNLKKNKAKEGYNKVNFE